MRRLILVVALVAAMCGTAWGQAGMTRHQPFTHSGRSMNPTTEHGVPITPHSCWDFDSAVGGTYTDDCANTYTMTVNGAPTLLANDGTWPNGLGGAAGKAWDFDGAADWMDITDAASGGAFDMDLVNNPRGSFTLQCAVTPHTVAAGTDYIISKFSGVNQRSYALLRNGAALNFYVSDDGTAGAGHQSLLSAAAALAAYRPAFITVTYRWVTDGTSEARIYVDNLATATSNVFNGPVFDSTADFVLAGMHGGLGLWEGLEHDCRLFKGQVFTEAQHDDGFAFWQGRNSTVGGNVRVDVASASPPAIMQKDCATADGCFIDQPANSSYISIHGHDGVPSTISKWWRGSCETINGGTGECQGWSIAENQGGGGATVTTDAITTTSAHGGGSIRFSADNGGLPKWAWAGSQCIANWVGQDVSLFAYGKTLTGTANCQLRIFEYSDGACANYLTSGLISAIGDPGASWTCYSGTRAAAGWNAGTNSWKASVYCAATGTAYTAAFDAAMVLQAPATFATDASCTTDADADAVCTDIIASGSNPLTPADWTVQGFYSAAQDGAETTVKPIFHVDATAGNANQIDVFHDSDVLTCRVYDSAGNNHDATVAMAYSVTESWQWRITHTDIGQVGCCVRLNGAGAWTCGAEAAAAIMDGIDGTYYVGNDAGAGGNDSEKSLQFFRRKLP